MTITEAIPSTSPSVAEIFPDAIVEALPIAAARPASPCADHVRAVSHTTRVGADLDPGQTSSETHCSHAGVQLSGSHADIAPRTDSAAVELLFCAAFLDDIEKLRIATENRLRSLTAEGVDAEPYAKQADALAAIEHQATLAL